MRTTLATLTLSLLALAVAFGGDGDEKAPAKIDTRAPALPALGEADEAAVLAFVTEHHPELAKVLEVLKPMNPAEYRKALVELSLVRRSLADLKTRNPKRYEMALDAWKTKSRVELIAAQLAGSPGEELRSQLRLAIEAKLDAEVRRQKFDLEQAEAAAKKARESLDRLEKHRDAIVEARYRALLPKKVANKAKRAAAKASVAPASQPTPNPTKPNGEDRR